MKNLTFKIIDSFMTELDNIEKFEATVQSSFLDNLGFKETMTESDFQGIFSGVFHIFRNKYQAFND